MSRTRRVIAGLLTLRAELKAGGTNLTVTDFVLAASAQTLAEFPDVNSRTEAPPSGRAGGFTWARGLAAGGARGAGDP